MADPRFDPVSTNLLAGEREALRDLLLSGAQHAHVEWLKHEIAEAARRGSAVREANLRAALQDLRSAIAVIVGRS